MQPSGSTVSKGRVKLREKVEREAKGDPAVFYYWMGGCGEDKAGLFSEAYSRMTGGNEHKQQNEKS